MSASDDAQRYPPDGSVPAKVVAALDRLARGMRSHRQQVAGDAGLTVLQADLLRTLVRGEPPPAFAIPLAKELGVSQPTVSDSLAALERKGYVERAANPQDRRRTAFVLTVAGARVADALALADDTLLTGIARLTGPGQEQLLGVLLDLITCLLDSGAIDVARTCPTCRFFDQTGPTRRCTLLQVELGPRDLRVDCPEHQPVPSLSAP